MKKVYLGHTKRGDEIRLDFEKESIKFILLIGQTGSGKSIFHNNMYKQLSAEYSSDEISFVCLDMTMKDFHNWQSDYLLEPVINNPQEALTVLNDLAETEEDKKIFIHIEECDMVYTDREKLEAAFEKIKALNNVYVIFSTSRLDRRYLSDWMKRFINLKVVFSVPKEDDSNFLIGNDIASHFSSVGERVLVFNNQQFLCCPFNDKEVEVLTSFKL